MRTPTASFSPLIPMLYIPVSLQIPPVSFFFFYYYMYASVSACKYKCVKVRARVRPCHSPKSDTVARINSWHRCIQRRSSVLPFLVLPFGHLFVLLLLFRYFVLFNWRRKRTRMKKKKKKKRKQEERRGQAWKKTKTGRRKQEERDNEEKNNK